MKEKLKKSFILIFILFLFFFFPKNSFAQIGIKASPLRFEEIVEPGQVLTKYIKITNTAENSQTFYIYPMDFKGKGEGGEAFLMPSGAEEGPYLSSWVQATKEGVSFQAGEEKQIPITFKVPANIGPGGYYGAIVVGPQPPKIDPKEGVALALTHQVAVLALFYVKGDVVEEARIREFSTEKIFYNAPFDVKFITRIENLGNVHIKPVGAIEIKNFFGKKVEALILNKTGANILPKSIRRFENSWVGDIGFGRYTASLVFTFGATVSEGGKGIQTLTAQTSFWILPWKVIIPVILIFLFLILLFVLIAKIYKDKALKKALQEAGLMKVRYVKKYQGPSPFIYLVIIALIILILIGLIGGLIFILFFR